MNSRDSLILAVLTFITVIVWIASDIYHASVTSTLTDVEKKLMVPLDPSFDQQVINKLKERNGL